MWSKVHNEEINPNDGHLGEAKLDHKRLAAFALQFSSKDRASPCQLAALVCVKNPTCDELRRTGDGDRIVKCHRPRRVTHHQVERKIAIVEIAPAFYRHRDVAVGYCVREKSNVWVHPASSSCSPYGLRLGETNGLVSTPAPLFLSKHASRRPRAAVLPSSDTSSVAPSPLTSKTSAVRNLSLRARSAKAIVTAFDSASAFAST